MDDLKTKIVRKLASNAVTGKDKRPIEEVKKWGVPSHDRGRAEEVIREMIRDPTAPVEQYGGRDEIRLTSIQDAKEFIVKNGGELPWGLKYD